MTTSQEWAEFLRDEVTSGMSTLEKLQRERDELFAEMQDPQTTAYAREEVRAMLTGADSALAALQQSA